MRRRWPEGEHMTVTEQTTDRRSGHLPGDIDMWVMVLGDMVIFAGYFIVFMIYRSMHAPEFLAAQEHLDVNIGVVNTVILLTSSWLVVGAVIATRAGQVDRAIRLLYCGGLGGVLFMALKGYEWLAERVSDPVRVAAVRRFVPIAKDLGCTPAQLALAWCARNPNVSTVITGASRVAQVHENLGALEVLDRLTTEVMAAIDAATAPKAG